MAPSPSSSNGATTSVQVALRIRPPTNQDSTSIPARFQRTVINSISSNSISIEASSSTPSASGSSAAVAAPNSASSGKKQVFTFDQVHPPNTTQHAIFSTTAQPLISRFIDGFNCTILAYGQTSSGKTFTMTGIDLDADPSDPSNGMGIIPRSVSSLFARCRELKEERGTTWNYTIKGSFIEIYNEDLIDLLNSDDGSARALVQIREDKQGHIIWEGLREVTVKNANEVMNLIRQGTSIRRTNETDMNAQSSRSHAIFSLTLIQKKFTGSGAPPRSSSPLPPGGGRSPSRLARPASTMYSNGNGNRVSSPTFGRPGTPSFASAMGRGGSRPASSLGMLTADGGRRASLAPGGAQPNADGEGDWVTVVSKFHFVDLAGSERLKRTAAAGERIKEGISINSGLLALGNVISALGDPSRAKSHTASYIPYRDSKLTRLLQDSLGGNAHTLMIACVSPAEWNANETINTLKYANRARNIKNRAVVNEKEEGWDDVEWLQGMVTRLRKDLKSIKDGGAIAPAAASTTEVSSTAVQKAYSQMAELRQSYEDIREKYVERTEELTRLRRELAEKQRSSGGAVGGTAKYEEIVGPVIEEYEKTISAMEAELSLNRAALRHTNDLVDEKEAELAQLSERHSTTEMYVEELRSRVSKLSEREASTEAYIRDLEEKVKLFNEDSLSSSGSITDLRRELAKVKDVETHSTQYIADLEARLAKSDESVLTLQRSVEELEQECDARREDVRSLQTRLEQLQQDGQEWRNDLEEREKKISKIEATLREREATLQATAETRDRLGAIVNDVSEARKNLEAASIKSGVSSIQEEDGSLEAQLVALQHTHTATLTDLSSVTSKYRDALREITDLAAQLQEAKVNASIPPTPLSESPERPAEAISPRRRMTRGSSNDGALNGSARRLQYRQATSSESLHSKSVSQSVSLSQELSSARSRKASTSSHGTSSSMSSHRPSLSLQVNSNERSVQSLEQEIMRLQEVLKEREAEITSLEQSLIQKHQPSPPMTPMVGEDASPSLHLSPKTISHFKEIRRSLNVQDSLSASDAGDSLVRLNELMRSMAQKESSHREVVDGLNADLNQLRRQHDELTVLSRDQALNMSSEIEGLHHRYDDTLGTLAEVRQHEAELLESLERAQAEHSTVVQQLKTEHEEALRAKEAEVDALLAKVKEENDAAVHALLDQLANASATLEKARQDHEDAFGKLKTEHEEELRRRSEEVAEVLEHARQEHETALAAALDKAKAEYDETTAKLQAEHVEELNQRSEQHKAAVEDTRKEYEEAMAKIISDHQESLKAKEEGAAALLQHTEDEYYEALTKLRQDHAQALEKQSAEAATALERLKDEHTRDIRMAEIAREGSLSQSQSSRETALKELQEAHAAAAAAKEAEFTEDLNKLKEEHAQLIASKEEQHRVSVQRLKADHSATLHDKEAALTEQLEQLSAVHARALSTKDSEHQAVIEQLASEHSAQLKKLQEESAAEVAKLSSELEQARNEHSATVAAHEALEATLQQTKDQQATILQEVEQSHRDSISKLASEHDVALTEARSRVEEERATLLKEHTEEIARLRAEHQATVAAMQSELIASQDKHRQDLEETRAQTERLHAEEKARLTASLSDLASQHGDELETLRKDRDLLADEKTKLAAALAEAQEQHRDELTGLRSQHEGLASERSRLAATVADMSTRHAAEYAVLQQEHDLLLEELESHKAAADEFAFTREDARRKHESALQEKDALVAELQRELQEKAARAEQLERSLQKAKEELDGLHAERSKHDTVLRDLQAQLTRSPSPGTSRSRANGIPAPKLPPVTPLPQTPVARSMHESQGSIASSARSTDSMDSPSTPATSIASMPPPPLIVAAPDPKMLAQVKEQAKTIDEQEVMIKTLNKQLTHCETDLQAHIDMVNTLESNLADAEKNLRKARMQATEISRERDNLNTQVVSLRQELVEAKNEVATVRRSVVEEKQSLELRLDEERRAKERARAQLDNRMDELQRRKSKFACL